MTDIIRRYHDNLAKIYGRPATEQNYQKRQREHAAFSLDREMFPKARAKIMGRAAETQSASDRDECLELVAWLDAKMGAI